METKLTSSANTYFLGNTTISISGCEWIPCSEFDLSVETGFYVNYEFGKEVRRTRSNTPPQFTLKFTIIESSLKPDQLWFINFMKEKMFDCRVIVHDLEEIALDGRIEIIGIDYLNPQHGAYRFQIQGFVSDPKSVPPTIKKSVPLFHNGRVVQTQREPTPIHKPKRKVSFD